MPYCPPTGGSHQIHHIAARSDRRGEHEKKVGQLRPGRLGETRRRATGALYSSLMGETRGNWLTVQRGPGLARIWGYKNRHPIFGCLVSVPLCTEYMQVIYRANYHTPYIGKNNQNVCRSCLHHDKKEHHPLGMGDPRPCLSTTPPWTSISSTARVM